MKKITELELERGLDKKKDFILTEILREEHAERCIENFLDHPLSLKHLKKADSIPVARVTGTDDQ
jgi:hypothetical protein